MHFTIFLPFVLSVIFTVFDIFVGKFISGSFAVNPGIVIISFLELYLISGLTMIFIAKEKMAKKY